MKIQYILILLLLIISVVMIFIGIKAQILPPTLTGVGFIIISFLLYLDKYMSKNNDTFK
jgi:hypothetical protein